MLIDFLAAIASKMAAEERVDARAVTTFMIELPQMGDVWSQLSEMAAAIANLCHLEPPPISVLLYQSKFPSPRLRQLGRKRPVSTRVCRGFQPLTVPNFRDADPEICKVVQF